MQLCEAPPLLPPNKNWNLYRTNAEISRLDRSKSERWHPRIQGIWVQTGKLDGLISYLDLLGWSFPSGSRVHFYLERNTKGGIVFTLEA